MSKSPRREHLFYTCVAVLYALVVFVGFSRTYYLREFFGRPRLTWLFHIHGLVFTAWTLFFVFQTALVALGRTDVHRRIGWSGAVFGGFSGVFGGWLTVYVVRTGYPTRSSQMPELLISGLMDAFLFGVFFGLGLMFRRRPAIHKRLMLIAMLSLIVPAIARLPIPPATIGWAILALSLVGMVYDAVSYRRIYLSHAVCILVLNIWSPLHFVVVESRMWRGFTEYLSR